MAEAQQTNSPGRLVVIAEPLDVENDLLAGTVEVIRQSISCSIYSTEQLEKADIDSSVVLVGLGSKVCKLLLGRTISITKCVGQEYTIDVDGVNLPVIVQYSPRYIQKQDELKGGYAEKVRNEWLEVWSVASMRGDGEQIDVPDTCTLKNDEQICRFLAWLVDDYGGPIAYDYETYGDKTALRPELCTDFRVLSIGVAHAWRRRAGGEVESTSVAFPLDWSGEASPAVVDAWRRVIQTGRCVAHFAAYEHKVNLKRFGVTGPMKCTALMAHVIDELAQLSLGRVMMRCGVGWYRYKVDHAETQVKPLEADLDDLLRYNALDALATLECFRKMTVEIENEGLTDVLGLDCEICECLSRQETIGLFVNQETSAKARIEMSGESAKLLAELRSHAAIKNVEKWANENIKAHKGKKPAFNPKSTPMIRRLCKTELKIPEGTTVRGTSGYDKNVLKEATKNHPVLAGLAEYRLAESLVGFLAKWGEYIGPDGCVHTSYDQSRVVTSRLSSRTPPLQNIPKDHWIRRIFVSRYPGGVMVNADFVQQEPRLLAGCSGDERLVSALAKGLDLHRFAAAEIFRVQYNAVTQEERELGKRMNLGILYGQTEHGLSKKTGLSLDDAKSLLTRYATTFAGVTQWKVEQQRHVIKHGWIADLFGYRRRFSGMKGMTERQYSRALRQAINFVIQSTAYRFTQITTMVLMHLLAERGLTASVAAQVHDSVVVDSTPTDLDAVIATIRESFSVHDKLPYWTGRGVPMLVDIKTGPNLFAMTEVSCGS